MTPPAISLLLPSRGRPDSLRRMLESARDQAADPAGYEVILRLDDDDAPSLALDLDGLNVRRQVGPRLTMGAYNAVCLAAAQGSILAAVNDDMVIRTPGWDRLLIQALAAIPDGIVLAWPDDQLKRHRMPVFPVLTRQGAALIGEPYPAAYKGACIDLHLQDIFQRLKQAGHDRCRFLPAIVFEHRHYRTGKSAMDDTYRSRRRFGDNATFLALASQRAAAAERLLAAIENRPVRPLPAPSSAPGLPALLADGGLPLAWRLTTAARFAAHALLRHWLDPARQQRR